MNTTSTAVAKRDTGPAAVIGQYTGDFGLVLPATFRPETFVRLAQGALRRDAKLRQAAEENPGSLLHALLDAARLGHEPGTGEYYLTPRRRKDKASGKYVHEVLGIEGYKGLTKRMMQHPKVLSVVAEVVYENDVFEWSPGQMQHPRHEVSDWFGDRGEARGAYAYAILAGGVTSKVVIVGPKEIERAIASSEGARSAYSPWTRDRDAMIRKTALRRLEPFVPKASEVTAAEQERTVKAAEVTDAHDLPALPPAGVDTDTGEVLDGELVDAADPADGADPWANEQDGEAS